MKNKRKTGQISKHVHPLVARIVLLWQMDVWYLHTLLSPLVVFGLRLWKRFVPLTRLPVAHISALFFVGVIAVSVLVPSSVYADMNLFPMRKSPASDYGSLPESALAIPRKTFVVPITAYTSDPWQTDNTPCITASGLNVCERGIENVVAANFLPIGTRVRIPELYGEHVFYVEDRMNARYDRHLDIWMGDLADAKAFGLKHAEIEVF